MMDTPNIMFISGLQSSDGSLDYCVGGEFHGRSGCQAEKEKRNRGTMNLQPMLPEVLFGVCKHDEMNLVLVEI